MQEDQEMVVDESTVASEVSDEAVGGEVTLEGLAMALARLQDAVEQISRTAHDATDVPTATEEPTLSDAFRVLYPDVSEGDIPDAVWEEARNGLPLEAAYALFERRESLRRAAAEEVNRKNERGAWGRTDAEADRHLSPDEVRAMTPTEVRENYARIIESMKHWN